MKRKIITLASVDFLIATISLVFYSCKKGSEQSTQSKSKIDLGSTNVVYPSFPNNEKINDHLRHLAFATASLFDLAYLNAGTSQYISETERIMPDNRDECSYERYSDYMDDAIYKNYGNNATPYDYDDVFNDAIQWSNTAYQTYQPRTNLWSQYDHLAFKGFNFNFGGYYTLLRIPNFNTLKNEPSRLTKPVVVVSNEEDANGDLLLPIVGFSYNSSTDNVDMIQWQTEEDFEDETGYYIWVTDYAPIPLNSSPSYNCTGENSPIANDDFCDKDCGENSDISFNDCNAAFLRKVWIQNVQIVEDYKQKCGINYQWLESRLHGQYEIGYQCIVAHARGKAKLKGGLLDEKFEREEILMTKKLGPGCNFNPKNSSNMKYNVTAWLNWQDNQFVGAKREDLKSKQPKAYLSENYKPWRDTIYLLIYEFDPATTNNSRDRSINVITRPGKNFNLEYTTRKNEGPWGDKTNTNNVVAFNSLNPINVNGNNIPNAQVIMITPQSWPGQGLFGVAQDEFEVNASAIGTGSGANPNAYTVKIKLQYGY